MKIEGYASEFADFFALFANYVQGTKKVPDKSEIAAQAAIKAMFPSESDYPPSYDEGYPPTFENGRRQTERNHCKYKT